MSNPIDDLLEEYRKTCFLVKDSLDNPKAIKLMAMTIINAKSALLAEVLKVPEMQDEELGSRPPALDGASWEEYTTKEHRNELRSQLRKAYTELFGGKL